MGQLNIRKSIKDSLKKIRFRQLIILLISWIIIIHYFERTTVANHIKKCDWSKWEHWPKGSNPHHSIIIGDPQIVDKFSYPNRSEPILKFTQRLSDNYLHRNHQIYHKLLTPDTTLYIGDLFDGGREWENDIWYEEYKRFNEIFNPITNTRTFKQIPGNHDIGFGNAVNFTKYNRFRSFFGDSNDYFTIGNHSLILLDTISLSSSENPDINTPSSGFLQDLSNPLHPAMQFPRLLLTHVPLYRFTEKQTCGPLRESKKKFPVMRGKQYQTVLEYELSQKILNIIKPKVIFSGDDHDYCHIRHPLTTTSTTQEKKQISGESFTDEITVKTSAMTGGIKKPAIQLISMWNPQDDDNDDKNDFEKSVTDSETGKLVVEHDTFKSRLCYLPDPYLALKIHDSKNKSSTSTSTSTSQFQNLLIVDEIIVNPINCLSKSIDDPNLARSYFIEIYSTMAPIVTDLLIKNYSNFQNLAVFKDFDNPYEQSFLFANISKFIKLFKFETFYKNMVIRLNTILNLFINSIIKEIDSNLNDKNYFEVKKLVISLDNLSINDNDNDIEDIEIDPLESLLEYFINRHIENYSFLISGDLVNEIFQKVDKFEKGVVKNYKFDFDKVDLLFDHNIKDTLNEQLFEIESIFEQTDNQQQQQQQIDSKSGDLAVDEVPIVLKVIETFLSSYLIGGLIDKLVLKSKQIDQSDDVTYINDITIEGSNKNDKPFSDKPIENDHRRINMMNETSLFFQCVPYLHYKLISTFNDLNYPETYIITNKQKSKMNYIQVVNGFINFYYEQHLLEFSEMLPKQCYSSLSELITTWESNKDEDQKLLEEEILKLVDDQEDKSNNNNTFDIFSSFTSIFQFNNNKKTENNVISKEQKENEKKLTKLAAKMQILTTNVQNIKSLVSMDLTVIVLHHVKNSYDLLIGLTEFSTTKEITDQIYTTCSNIFIDMLSILIERHINPGFHEALTRLKDYNPTELKNMSSSNLDVTVEPLTNFIELVNVGDLILQMVNIFYQEELVTNGIVKVKPKQNRDFLSSNQCEKSISRLEQLLDTYVADGLDVSIGVIMNEVTYTIMRCAVNETTYNIDSIDNLLKSGGGASKYVIDSVKVLDTHFKLLNGSIDKAILDVFKEEIGERFVNTLIKIILKKLIISTIGAIQFITDINYLYDFFVKVKVKPTVGYFVGLKKISQLFLVECNNDKKQCKELGKLVIEIGRDNGVFSPEEVYTFVSRRSDWITIKRHVDNIMYGFGPDDCIVM
ncbi:hypothetical protein CANARDRAFT_197525 [[Candida] arabinofermentans NRRL YB-2248]|uniref:Uncharacterized protein n=1 Tax=[Candida] arabinofermentans NRRL YB-2248 TaxID=983967 RepID=A0A1E4T2H1_9ASCO|nr:hypothetical protein CANARDRAFT_197525 [[Candida] arabinofermentans NRRL YB-2248]